MGIPDGEPAPAPATMMTPTVVDMAVVQLQLSGETSPHSSGRAPVGTVWHVARQWAASIPYYLTQVFPFSLDTTFRANIINILVWELVAPAEIPFATWQKEDGFLDFMGPFVALELGVYSTSRDIEEYVQKLYKCVKDVVDEAFRCGDAAQY